MMRTSIGHQPRNPTEFSDLARDIRNGCGIDVVTTPSGNFWGAQYTEIRLINGRLEKPVQINSTVLRWLLPRIGSPLAILLEGRDKEQIMAFGYREDHGGIRVGGRAYPKETPTFGLTVAMSQVGNRFFFEGVDSILYPGIVIATPRIIRGT